MLAQHPISSEEDRAEAIRLLIDRLEGWHIPDSALDRVHEAARKSLDEVKALTEYEDGKVSRLLTIIAFLSAVVAAVFTRFASDYIWPGLLPTDLHPDRHESAWRRIDDIKSQKEGFLQT